MNEFIIDYSVRLMDEVVNWGTGWQLEAKSGSLELFPLILFIRVIVKEVFLFTGASRNI